MVTEKRYLPEVDTKHAAYPITISKENFDAQEAHHRDKSIMNININVRCQTVPVNI